MKKSLGLMTILLMVGFSLFGKVDTSVFEVTTSSNSATELKFDVNINDFDVKEVNVNGEVFQELNHPEAGYLIDAGKPELPTFSAMIAVPNTGRVNVELISYDEEVLSGWNIIPSQGVIDTSIETPEIRKDEKTYNTSEFYGTKVVEMSSPGILRDYRVVSVTVNPFSYNPVTKELLVKRNVKFAITTSSGTGVNEIHANRPHSRAFENIYSGLILNYDEVRNHNVEYQPQTLYIVYHETSSIASTIHQIADWKRQKGFEVVLMNTMDESIGNTAEGIRNALMEAYSTDLRPDYILVIGDVTGPFAVPASNQYGDHMYISLDGDDILGDAMVGRLSAEQPIQLMTIWNKIKLYEKDIYMDEIDWYRTNLLVGDSAHSGTSTYYTNLYILDLMREYDNSHYFYTYFNDAPPISEMNQILTDGVLIFNYRGYLGMSGWNNTHIYNDVNNINKLTNAVIITCDTGTFYSTYSEARTEAYIRAGTPGAVSGAVSAIGMATSSTHTRFNNSLNGGIFHGLYMEHMNTMGEAVLRGKVNLYENYINNDASSVSNFTYWCNQMGDPSMAIWKSLPMPMIAAHPSQIDIGCNYFDVTVTNMTAQPIENAWVTVRQIDDEGVNELMFATGYTDAEGKVRLDIDAQQPGTFKVTVTAPQYIPYIQDVTITDNQMITLENTIIDDSEGDNNGEFNAGETIQLVTEVINNLSSDVNNVTATLSTDDPYVTIIENNADFGNIVSNGNASSSFEITSTENTPDMYKAELTLTLTDGNSSWNNAILLTIKNSNVEVLESIVINDDNSNGIVDPGEQFNLNLTVENSGSEPIQNLFAKIFSTTPYTTVYDEDAHFGDINVGESVTCSNAENFQIKARGQLVPGMTIVFNVKFYNENGFEDWETIHLLIGNQQLTDPVGPDSYGYMIFDDGDVGYVDCPVYDWYEIDPTEEDHIAEGFDTGMVDVAEDDDKVVNVDLPFIFKFYGKEYSSVNICTNGWVSFVETNQATFRNWILPGPLGPQAQIAAFWDDIYTGDGAVYYAFLEDYHAFVIEWSRCESRVTGNEDTFQIILYNPDVFPTAQGDGTIKIQYKTISNDDANGGGPLYTGGNYCSVGIEDETSLRGLQYTFGNMYHPAAKELQDEMALLITGLPVAPVQPYVVYNNTIIYDDNGNGILESGESARLGIRLSNYGETDAEETTASLISNSAYVTVTQDESEYPTISSGLEATGLNFFEVSVSSDIEDDFGAGFTLSVTDQTGGNTQDWIYPFVLPIVKAGVEYDRFVISEVTGDFDGIPDIGETIKVGVILKNQKQIPVENVSAAISTENTDITLVDNEIVYGKVGSYSETMQIFELQINESATDEELIICDLSFTGDSISDFTEQLSFQVGTASQNTDFEEDNGGFTGSGSWQWGEWTNAHSGSKVWGTNLTGSYGNNANDALITEPMTLIGEADLEIWHNYNTEASYDGGNVHISTDGGTSWTLLVPVDGYDGTVYASSSNGEEVFRGNSDGWVLDTFDLSDYIGEEVMIKFGFYSDGSVTYDGWYIDDVTIGGVAAEFGGMVSGNVVIENGDGDVTKTLISAGSMNTTPNGDGDYSIILPENTYNISAMLPYYSEGIIENVSVVVNTPSTGNDFSLSALEKPENVDIEQYIVTDVEEPYEEVKLTWDFNGDEGVYFSVYQRWNTGSYQLIGTSTTNEFILQDLVANSHYDYYVIAVYPDGESQQEYLGLDDWIYIPLPINNDNDITVPLVTKLIGNYPNPFNPITNISFQLKEDSPVTLKVYNVKGQLVKTLVSSRMQAGTHKVTWFGDDNTGKKVSTGVYFYKMDAGRYSQTRKALMLK